MSTKHDSTTMFFEILHLLVFPQALQETLQNDISYYFFSMLSPESFKVVHKNT